MSGSIEQGVSARSRVRRAPGHVLRPLVSVVALVGLAANPSAALATDQPGGRGPLIEPGALVVDQLPDAPPGDAGNGLVPVVPALAGSAALTAAPDAAPVGGLTACFAPDVPPDVRSDVVAALSSLDNALELSGPSIEVDVSWTTFPSIFSLAAAGPGLFVTDARLPRPDTRYPVALANELLQTDFSARPLCDAGRPADVILHLNRDAGGGGADWHFGPAAPPPGRIDLRTVVLHEVVHGLGFITSATVVGGSSQWPADSGRPYVFDRSIRRCARPCSSRSSGTLVVPANGEDLTGGDLSFDVLNGPLVDLHVPPFWASGLSVSHLDEAGHPPSSGLALMTPFVGRGERYVRLDPAAAGVLQSLGWSLADPPAPLISASASPLNAGLLVSGVGPPLPAGVPASAYDIGIWRATADGQNVTFERTITVASLPATIAGLVNGAAYSLEVRPRTAGGTAAGVRTALVRPLEMAPFVTAGDFARRQLLDWKGAIDPTALAGLTARARVVGDPVALITDEIAEEASAVAERKVVRLYLGFFHRRPDTDGLRFWVDRTRHGASLEGIAGFFAQADEFAQGADVSDAEFVTEAYRRILQRSPDAAGHRYWVERLGTDLRRGRMLLLFTESPEHRARSEASSELTMAFWNMLGRRPSVDEESAGIARFAAGGRRALVADILVSGEYLTRLDH